MVAPCFRNGLLVAFAFVVMASAACAEALGPAPVVSRASASPHPHGRDAGLADLQIAVALYTRPSPFGSERGRIPRRVYPLHWAAVMDHAADLSLLLDAGADPDARDQEGRTPLMVAAAFDSRSAAEMLLAHGADPLARENIRGNTALDFAAMAGHPELAALLLTSGADVNGRAHRKGETPLHYAALFGQRGMIEFLIRSGAAVDAGDSNGVRPLQYARIRKQGLAVELLLRLGARPDTLHEAVNAGDVGRVQALLAGGADIHEHNLLGTALHIAAATGQTWIAVMLIDAGAELEATGDPVGSRPLHMAALGNHAQTARLLLDRGAAVDGRDAQERTALAVAASYGNVEVGEILLSAGADPVAQNIYRDTAMHNAALSGDLEMVDLLMSFGVDVNIRSGHAGETPLIYAVRCDGPEMVAFLLANGADASMRDKTGRTPLEIALRLAHAADVVDLLRQAAAPH